MVKTERPYHALALDETLRLLDVDRERGLSRDEISVRRERFGPNVLREAQRRGAWRIFLDQFKSIVILLLVAAATAALATARWPEGIALVAVTLINTLIGFFSEWKAVRSMEALRELVPFKTRVRREGREQLADAEDLVPGDIVRIEPEDLVPADLRVLEAQQLRLNEAALTGESLPVDKTPQAVDESTPLAERRSMLYKGTTVTAGSGEAVVVSTGMATELGRISRMSEEAEAQSPPLQKQLDKLGRRLAWITIGIAAAVALAGLAAERETMLMLETAIALGIAAVPEGLPVVATIALARGMYLMAKRNAVVNRLAAVETLGATRIILTDKTGTLTENRMRVRRAVTAAGEYELGGDRDPKTNGDPLLQQLVRGAILCNNAVLSDEDGRQTGDPTEVALLEVGIAFDLDRQALLGRLPEVREETFDTDVMMMATFHRTDEGILVAVKGAPQAVLEACATVAGNEGDQELNDDDRRRWLDRVESLASDGLRLLAVADKKVDSADAEPYAQLRFLGLLGMFDPPREEVREAVQECQRAGIRAVMVTGDRPDTGQAIGEQVGLTHDGHAILGSALEELDALSEEDRKRLLGSSIFARVTPEQKLNLVKLFQEQGETVAMTGDGVNDAPALKQADIGIAMGKRGTATAKEVADMVLRDDEFSTIVAAVRQGRIIFANIRKSVVFMLCTNLAEILAVSLASLGQAPIPLHPLQILYLNVLTDVFPALALGVGKGDRDVMKRPPRNPGEPVLTGQHWLAICGWSIVIGACVLAALSLALLRLGFSETKAITVSFLTLGFAKLWFVLNLRDRGATVWDNDIVRNPAVWASLVLCAALLGLAVYWPPLAGVLNTEPLGADGWLLVLGMSVIPALLGTVAPGIAFYAPFARSERGSKRS